MNLVFFGSSDFSIPVLSALMTSMHRVRAVVTVPPKPKGRGQKVSATVVKAWADEKSLTCFSPERLNDPVFEKELRAIAPDCLVVASYGKMLPNWALTLPRQYPLNVHPSLLPRYRGAAPIARQLLNGEKQTGITIAQITEKLDAGAIIAQETVPILPDEDNITLGLRLAKLGGTLVLKVLDQIGHGPVSLQPQNESEATYASKLDTSVSQIDWTRSAAEIANQVRALVPWPCAFFYCGKERIKVMAAAPVSGGAGLPQPAGVIQKIDAGGTIDVQTGAGVLRLKLLKPDSGKAMSAQAFAAGRRLKPGGRFL